MLLATKKMQLRITLPPQANVLPPKTAEILRAVRTAFVEKGFDGASMQDLARAAGMSVGNFYRYFPSKDAIITQMIALDLDDIQTEFARVLQSGDPMAALRALIARRISGDLAMPNAGQLWAEIAAAAQRKPDIAISACAMEKTVIDYLAQVFAAETGLTALLARQKFAAQAAYIIMLIRASAMMAPQDTADSADLNSLILRTINQVLDDIASAGSKG
jgi:AcrR family transcriptional regulator